MKLWAIPFENVVRRHQSSFLDLRHPDFYKDHEIRVILKYTLAKEFNRKIWEIYSTLSEITFPIVHFDFSSGLTLLVVIQRQKRDIRANHKLKPNLARPKTQRFFIFGSYRSLICFCKHLESNPELIFLKNSDLKPDLIVINL